LLDLLSKTNKNVVVYSKNMNIDLIKKYQEQYQNVQIIENNSFHDRFIIIDNKDLYHCGASFKELGKKCFAINRIEDIEAINKLNNLF
jgi:phospholipid N-methyltransferase